MLPLGPTGYGDSPYASFSSFAGNPLLISLDKLVEWGDLNIFDLLDVPDFPVDFVEYGWVIYWKVPLLETYASQILFDQTMRFSSRANNAEFYRRQDELIAWLPLR